MEMDLLILFLGFATVMCYIAILCRAFLPENHGILIGGNVWLRKLNQRNRKGPECEVKFNKTLQCYIAKDDCLLANVVINNKKETLGEIDSVLVSRKGIFCIEIKCNTGHGKGNDKALHWKFKKDPNQKSCTHVLNPVMQNERHCELLKNALGRKYAMHNIVVFPNASSITKIRSNKVFTTDTFLSYYKSLESNQLRKKDILRVVDSLSENISIIHGKGKNKKLNKEEMTYFELP